MKIFLITNIYSSDEIIGRSNIYVEKLSKELADIGGIPELIKKNCDGFLFKRNIVDQLKEILENIIRNSGRLIELGKNAQEFIKKDEMSEHIKKIIKIYKEAIEINRVQTI